jgi:hypothetical protein
MYGPQPYGAPVEPARPKRSGFVGLARIGFIVAGAGEAELDCSGAGCPSAESVDYDEQSGLVLGADFMGHVLPSLRLGGGLLFVPNTEIDVDGGDEADLGSDLSLQFIVEGIVDVGSTTALAVRGQAGALILFPGGDLEDGIDESKDECEQLKASGGSCEVDEGAYVGWTVGGGAGVIIDVGGVGLRMDLLLQWYGVDVAAVEVDDPLFGHVEQSTYLVGTRVLLTAGLEF